MQHKKLDLLLINPGGRKVIYQSLADDLSAIEPPFWAGLMATFVRKKGFSVRVLDSNAENLEPDEVADATIDLDPLLVGIVVYGHNPSASTQMMPSAGAICKAIKDRAPDLKIIMVGGHAAALPERTLLEEAIDFVGGGEGPYTLVDLLNAIKSGERDLGKVRSLYYRQNGRIHSTGAAPLVTDLDREMPEVAWDLLPMQRYRAHNWHCFGFLDQRQPYASLYTTLGCPFHCVYCCIQAPFKSGERVLGYKESTNSYRLWKPESVVAQIDKLVNVYGVRNIKFADELFVLNQRHVSRICDLLIERKYDLNIWAYSRVDTLKDPMLEKMKRAGINWLCLGIESGNKRVRDDVRKGTSQEDVYRAIKKLERAGIHVIANYLFGLPEDDFKSMQETLDLALELNCEFANFYCAMAYPGSKLYEIAVKEGWPLPKNWGGYSQHSVDSMPLPTKYISAEEVLTFRDRAFEAYFSRSDYIKMIERKFGKVTAEHIRKMLSLKLIRKLRCV